MRLINTETIQLELFPDDRKAPRYAILSHRWEDGEVLFEDMVEKDRTKISKKAGYEKIIRSCNLAAWDMLDYIWIDTCCIDKRSSAELSESINSMYRWYQKARVCYAFLSDVSITRDEFLINDSSFAASKWFTRGWTLQELIAPKHVRFYNSNWACLGTKDKLSDLLSHITNVDERVLAGASPTTCSIAQRMSWAASRETTRVEDMAYSLMGLFDVNMPMLYGEGEKAFLRLQEEIMKYSDDHSLFAWNTKTRGHQGLLAKSVTDFESCSHIRRTNKRLNRAAYSLGNVGLSIGLVLREHTGGFLAALDCEFYGKRIGIFLEKIHDDQFARVAVGGKSLTTFDDEKVAGSADRDELAAQVRQIYVRQDHTQEEPEAVSQVPKKAVTSRLVGLYIQSLAPLSIDRLESLVPNIPRSRLELTGCDSGDTVVTGTHCKFDRPIVRIDFKGTGLIATISNSLRTIQLLSIGLNKDLRPYCQLGLRYDSELVRFDGDDSGNINAKYKGYTIQVLETKVPRLFGDYPALVLNIEQSASYSLEYDWIQHRTKSGLDIECKWCNKPVFGSLFFRRTMDRDRGLSRSSEPCCTGCILLEERWTECFQIDEKYCSHDLNCRWCPDLRKEAQKIIGAQPCELDSTPLGEVERSSSLDRFMKGLLVHTNQEVRSQPNLDSSIEESTGSLPPLTSAVGRIIDF